MIVTDLGKPVTLNNVGIQRFEDTSSSKLEMQILLSALKTLQNQHFKIMVYTDSQTIVGLLERRKRLEQTAYRNKQNKLLNHYQLYKEFFGLLDQMDCSFVKVKGHLKTYQKDCIDKCFTIVDRAARKNVGFGKCQRAFSSRVGAGSVGQSGSCAAGLAHGGPREARVFLPSRRGPEVAHLGAAHRLFLEDGQTGPQREPA